MRVRILYFLLGVAFSAVVCAGLLYFDALRDFKESKALKIRASNILNPPLRLQESDLIGHWKGKGPWNESFEIVRNADHTFTKKIDSTKNSVPHKPAIYQTEGFWSFAQPGSAVQGAYAETDSDGQVWVAVVTPQSSKSLTYETGEEGTGISETKK
jgi:hypothetical protein